MLLFLIIAHTFNTVSEPIGCLTLSNPAFTGHLGNYEFYLEHSDIGKISFFNLSTQFKGYGLGFSSYFNELEETTEKRNCLSFSRHLNLPLSFGTNIGLIKLNHETDPLLDIGIWFRKRLGFGFSANNLLNRDRIMRIGISYEWKILQTIFEIADSVHSGSKTVHILLGLKQPIGELLIIPRLGYHPGQIVGGFEVQFHDFIDIDLTIEETARLSIGVNFSPPVVIKEVSMVETLTVERPIVIKKTEKYKLSKRKLKYCEQHYLKGIECYLDNRIEEAIEEWKKVKAVYPDYKELRRYMKNAQEKLKLLKE